MKPAPFDYFAPTSVDEVRGLLNAPPAIFNAISDAIGVKITEQPLPPTRILELMGAISVDR